MSRLIYSSSYSLTKLMSDTPLFSIIHASNIGNETLRAKYFNTL